MKLPKRQAINPERIDALQLWALFGVALLLTDGAIALRLSAPLVLAPVILLGLIFLPGLLLSRLLGLGASSILDRTLYAAALGIAFWIVGPLLLNWLLPALGVMRPLDLWPLWIFFNLAIIILIPLSISWRTQHVLGWRALSGHELRLLLFAPGFVLLSLLGSALLNRQSETGGTIILAMLALLALFGFFLSIDGRRVREGVYGWVIWCSALALLLMYSMRSSHILGWDINAEYQIFQATAQLDHWTTAQLGNQEYNTCLSITILPTVLGNFLPLASEYVYKLVFQLIFALLPVAVFALGKRYVSPRASYLAAFLFMGQTWFFEQMPALIRQEVALVFFGCALLAVFDPELKRRQRNLLFLIFSAALILSHYSTAYVFLALFALELIIFLLLRIFVPALRQVRARLNWKLLLLLIGFTFVWEGVVTNVGGAFAAFATNIPSHVHEAFASDTLRDNLLRFTFSPAEENTQQKLELKYQKVSAEYASLGLDLYPAQTYASYSPQLVDSTPRWPSLLGAEASSGLIGLEKLLKLLVIIVFPLVGVIYFLRSYRKKRGGGISEFIALGLAGVPLILAIILLPLFQVSYNISRLFLQAYVLLSLTSVSGAMVFFLCRKHNKRAVKLAAFTFALFFLFSSGFADRFLGGDKRITLSSDQGLTDPCYLQDSEVAGAKWLDRNYDGDSPIFADTTSSLRIQSFTKLNDSLRFDVFPSTLTQKGYVFQDRTGTQYSVAYTSLGNGIISYREPQDFLEDNKNLIYNSGSTKIYK